MRLSYIAIAAISLFAGTPFVGTAYAEHINLDERGPLYSRSAPVLSSAQTADAAQSQMDVNKSCTCGMEHSADKPNTQNGAADERSGRALAGGR